MESTKSRGNTDFRQSSQSKCDRAYRNRGALSSLPGNDAFMVDLAIDFDSNSSHHRHTARVNQTPCVAYDDLEDAHWRELLHRTSSVREGEGQPTQNPTGATTTKTQDVRGTKLRESLRHILHPWRRGDGKGLLRRRSNQSTAPSAEQVSATTSRQSAPLASQLNTNEKDIACHGTGSTCLHRSVWLLEDLVSWCDSLDTASVDNLLSNFRDALSACSRIAQCDRCTVDGSASDNNTVLLVTIARYMSTICERIVRLYIDMHSTYLRNQHDGASPPPSSPSGRLYRSASADDQGKSSPGKDAHLDGGESWREENVSFSSYHIFSCLERLHVLRSIIVVQMTDFGKFLEQLKIKETHRKSNFAFLIEALDTTSKAKEALRHCVSADSGW